MKDETIKRDEGVCVVDRKEHEMGKEMERIEIESKEERIKQNRKGEH